MMFQDEGVSDCADEDNLVREFGDVIGEGERLQVALRAVVQDVVDLCKGLSLALHCGSPYQQIDP
mgnify:CR=1 FL=1